MNKNFFNIVLYEPQIPQNTGNIARLCACTGSSLYLVGKLGFHITDRHVKRAGLDYWDSVNINTVSTFEELQEKFPDSNFYYLSTKATKKYTEITYQKGDFLVVCNPVAVPVVTGNCRDCLWICRSHGRCCYCIDPYFPRCRVHPDLSRAARGHPFHPHSHAG